MDIRRKGEKTRYSFVDSGCLGRTCFAPGHFQHRSPLSCGGSRNTGSPDSPCCMNRAYRGCPSGPVGERVEDCFHCGGSGVEMVKPAGAGHADDLAEYEPCVYCGKAGKVTIQGLPEVSKDLVKARKAEGWRA